MNASKDDQEGRLAGNSKQMTQMQIQVAELKEALQTETQSKLSMQLNLRGAETKLEQFLEQIEAEQEARKIAERNSNSFQQQVCCLRTLLLMIFHFHRRPYSIDLCH